MSAACSTLNGLGATTSYTQRFQASAFQAGESVSVSFSDNGAGIGGSPVTADVVILGQYSTVSQYRYSSDTGTVGSHVGSVDSSFLTSNGLYLRINATSYLSPVIVSCSGAALSSDATLSGLSLSAGTLAPGFAPGTTSYNVSVANSVSSIALTPTAASAGASLTVNGTAATSGATTTIPLAVGTNLLNVVVTAQDGSTQTYQINVARASAPPTAGAVSVSVAANSGDSSIPLSITGGAATAVAISTPPAHGTATASGTTILYRPNAGYVGSDALAYTASNGTGTSAPAAISVTVNPPAVSYAPVSPPGASVGAPYSQSVASAGGGTAPYNYALASGALPPGIALTSAGTLSGTPTGAGNYSFSVVATDSSTGNGPVSTTSGVLTLTVAAPTMGLNPGGSTFNAVPGQPFSQTFGASGGTGPYRYALSVQSGVMPTGMAFNAATGTLSGTPTGAGSVTFSVTATDSSTGTGGPFSVTSTYTLTVAIPTVTIGPATPSSATAGLAYSQTFTASGGASPYQFVITAGALPAGLSLSAAGALNGTPRAVGTFALTVMATDTNGYTGSRAINLNVAGPTIGLGPATVSGAAVGAPYSQAFTATGGNAPYTFSVVAGALPSGLTLASGGTLSGTPTVGGTYNFSVQVQDSTTGGTFTTTRPYTMTVGAATLTVSPPTLAAGTVGADYAQSLSTAGGTPGYTYAVTAGALPPGITLSGTGLLSGRPTAGGTFSFTVTSTDSSSGSGPFSGLQAYTMTVTAPTLVVAPATLPTPTVGMPYSQTLTASGGMAPYTFSVTGTLPAGLALSSTGVLSGTPTTGGSYNFTVRATDSSSGAGPYSASRSYLITLGAPTLALSPASLPAPTVGTVYSQTVTASGGVAPYTYAVTAGALPAGLTLDATTGAIRGTPTTSGAHTFSIRATDSSTGAGAPYSVARTFTLSTLQAIPTAPPVVVGTRANAPVTIHAAGSAANGPFTGVTIVTPPASGSTAVQGLDIVYTPALTSSGAITFAYALQNVAGQSAPIVVTVNVDAVPVPVASAQASVSSGKDATVNVTENASGGPFRGPLDSRAIYRGSHP
ncbi:S-layer family protein [Ralstonia sp. 25mfcol4.1]|uniref:beta strand repeat-containing protein n=1 Tax=Ralstonia sp. 25mfcol4.1 TaxID=1761899 RepID=UPI0015872F9D|nr:putative Ig domain-containing protein [Ralstonia sp. 25mfcol4.1]